MQSCKNKLIHILYSNYLIADIKSRRYLIQSRCLDFLFSIHAITHVYLTEEKCSQLVHLKYKLCLFLEIFDFKLLL